MRWWMILGLIGGLVGFVACAPVAVTPAPTQTTLPTPFPTATPPQPIGATAVTQDAALFPTAMPSPPIPCQMPDDDPTCPRYAGLPDGVVSDRNGHLLILRNQASGVDCLSVCSKSNDAVSLLDDRVTEVVTSADGAWLAYGTFRWRIETPVNPLPNTPAVGIPVLAVYKLRADGSERTRLDSQGFPRGTVGVDIVLWEPNGDWLDVRLWDGTENGWRPYRLKTDGSGVMGPISLPSPPLRGLRFASTTVGTKTPTRFRPLPGGEG